MFLKPHEIQVFNLHQTCFQYALWKFPVQWDTPQYTHLHFDYSHKTLIPYCCALASVAISSLMNLLCVITYTYLLPPVPYFTLFKIFNFLTYTVLLASAVTLVILVGNKTLAFYIEEVIIMAGELHQVSSTKQSPKCKYVKALTLIIIYASILPFVLVPTSLIINIDPTYFILRYFLGNNFDNLSLVQNILIILLRSLVILLTHTEALRTVTFILCNILLLLDRYTDIVKLILSDKITCHNTNYYLTKAKLQFGKVEQQINRLVYTTFTFLFWITVCFLWASVKFSSKSVTLSFYTIIIIGLIVFVGLIVTLLPKTSNIVQMMSSITKQNVKKAEYNLARNKIVLRTAKSIQQPLRIKFGFYGTINKSFVQEYYMLLACRGCESIIMIDF